MSTRETPRTFEQGPEVMAKPAKDERPGRATPVAADLWSRFSDELLAWFRARIRPPERADDLLQETFVRICRGLPRLRQPDRLGPWVYRITRAVLVDHLRRQRPEKLFGNSEPSAGEAAGSHAEGLDELVGRWLQEYLVALPPAYREAVQLIEVDGMTQVNLARLHGLSSSGSRSRVQRGRALLRKALLDCCDLDVDRRGNVIGYRRRPECCRGGSQP